MREKLRTIGEVARLTGVPVKTIRYYSDAGLLPPARVSEARYRLYGATEVWRLELIRALRRLGFALEDVRKVISGDLSVATAIAWQREAIEDRIRHLERVGAILKRAEASAGDPERSLEHLRSIGEALTVEAAERGRFLAERLLSAVAGDDAPKGWRERFLASASLQLPEELNPDQAAAWTELVALVNDPDFGAQSRQHTAPFWRMLQEERGIDAATWHEGLEGFSRRARAAVEAGAAPGDPAVQEVVGDYVALYARAMGEEVTAGFVRRFAALAPTFVNDEARRFRELLSRAGSEDSALQERAEGLLLDGLRWRAEREVP